MNISLAKMKSEMDGLGLRFISKPIIIGGMAMQYYDIRERGEDIDLVVTDDDYKRLLTDFSEKQKDVWGDLGIRVGEYEIFRSITLFDYDFYILGIIKKITILKDETRAYFIEVSPIFVL